MIMNWMFFNKREMFSVNIEKTLQYTAQLYWYKETKDRPFLILSLHNYILCTLSVEQCGQFIVFYIWPFFSIFPEKHQEHKMCLFHCFYLSSPQDVIISPLLQLSTVNSQTVKCNHMEDILTYQDNLAAASKIQLNLLRGPLLHLDIIARLFI